jgi:hypothetical protein
MGMGWNEEMNEFIFSFNPITIFNPVPGNETCKAGILRNRYPLSTL